MFGLSAIRAYLSVEADGPFTLYTGKLVKTLFYTLLRELRLYRGLRGVVSPLHISPLFRPGRGEWELGGLVAPRYSGGEEGLRVEPVRLEGEYLVHVGGVAGLVEKAARALEALRTPLQVKIGDSIVRVRLEKLADVSGLIFGKRLEGDKVTVYLKAPVKLFNVYTPSRLPKFSVSAVELLMTPFMLRAGTPTMSERLLLEAARLLGLLVETYYSITTVRPVLVPLNNSRDPGMVGKVTYIVDTRDPGLRASLEEVLQAAEAAGVGESRANGFGTVVWQPKP